jgi:hypothetical protein
MKGLLALFIMLVMTLVAFTALMPVANASSNVMVNGTVPTGTLYQGQTIGVDVSIKNNENYPVRIYKVGVHYDWMRDGAFYTLDLGNNYVQVESNSEVGLGNVLVYVDPAATTGYHQYYYKIELARYDTTLSSWLSEIVILPSTVIMVDSPYKSQALSLLQQANSSVYDARQQNYTSSVAKANMVNATEALNEAWSAYNSNDAAKVINLTQNITKYLSIAKVAQDDYNIKKNSTMELLEPVSYKLSLLVGAKSPEAKIYVDQSKSHINLAMKYIAEEDFANAKTEAKIAEKDADNALNAEYMYNLKVKENIEAMNKSIIAINDARSSINESSIVKSTPAISLLNEARNQLELAVANYQNSKYDNATGFANIASSLSSQALKTEAEYIMLQADQKIKMAGELKSQKGIEQLDMAKSIYNSSTSELSQGNYKSAISKATEAYVFANESIASEQKWKEENPLNTVVPGFEIIAALMSLICAAFVLNKRKA